VAKHQDHKRRRSPPKCSAVNWSEVAQKVTAHSADWELGSSLLLSFGLWIEPVSRADAEEAAALWRRGSGRSIADRICLATAHRLDAQVWTADTAWGASDQISQVR
jgi:PIN domain nuclease of toxin-antitoxin system